MKESDSVKSKVENLTQMVIKNTERQKKIIDIISAMIYAHDLSTPEGEAIEDMLRKIKNELVD